VLNKFLDAFNNQSEFLVLLLADIGDGIGLQLQLALPARRALVRSTAAAETGR
jgi:hypothetical protein